MLFLWLEQIIAYQQEIRVQDRNLNKAIRERDNVRILLEEVRLLRERDDEEIRKKLKVSSFSLCLTEAG